MTQTEFSLAKRCVMKKNLSMCMSMRIESRPLKMLFDISPEDFAHHVRHANSWNDLGIRCGLEIDEFGHILSRDKVSMLQQKVNNMRLNTDHFYGQQPQIPDDVFKTIIEESDCMYQIMKKCTKSHSVDEKERILKWIEDLCIDISHFKTRKPHPEYKDKKWTRSTTKLSRCW